MKSELQESIETTGTAAIVAFGERAQLVKACEELAELVTVLCKRLNRSPVDDRDIVDEVADVLIVVNQMRIIFGPELVDERIIYKLNRLLNAVIRVGSAKKENEK